MDGNDPRSPPPPMADDRYRLLVEAVTDYAIYMLDPEGVVSSWNPGAQRFKGYEAAEILGQNFSKFFTDEDRAAGLPRHILETAAREGRFEMEGWRVRKNGERMWAHVVVDPIRRPDGELVGFAKITRDMSDRRASDLALRQSEERFRLLVQGVTDYAIYMLDPDGVVTNWNSGAQRIKGYAESEIVGRHFSTFYTEEDRAAGEPQRALATAREEGRFEKESQRVRKDGTRFWAHVIIDPIAGEDGRIVGFAKVTRDITERVEAQKALEAAREAFFQSQKVEAIGHLTGGIAHDFNNLLSAVLGSLELLRKKLPDDPALVQLLDNAVQGANRGAALTQRMLAFARRQNLTVEPLDMPALVGGLSDLLKRTLGPTVTIETLFPKGLPPVLSDANQLELALLNLSVNARDAGASFIRIAASEEVAGENAGFVLPGRFVQLSVSDNGEGMDEETLARAAEPFFTTKGVGKGTGLGLSMVKGLAEQLGGGLRLKSARGQGTTAELWLPVANAQPNEKLSTAPAQTSANAQPRLRILAVDDDALVLMNTVAMLQDLGHEVFEASSGPEALALVKKQPVDLVITDHAMPRMTGVDLARELRVLRTDMPIILATGYAELPGGSDPGLPRLQKPFGQNDLARAIGDTLRVKA